MSSPDGLHRNKIRKALQHKGWEAKARVIGDVLVRPPGSASIPDGFGAQVREAVAALGYEADISGYRTPDGIQWIRVKTPETSSQSGRGGHD